MGRFVKTGDRFLAVPGPVRPLILQRLPHIVHWGTALMLALRLNFAAMYIDSFTNIRAETSEIHVANFSSLTHGLK